MCNATVNIWVLHLIDGTSKEIMCKAHLYYRVDVIIRIILIRYINVFFANIRLARYVSERDLMTFRMVCWISSIKKRAQIPA